MLPLKVTQLTHPTTTLPLRGCLSQCLRAGRVVNPCQGPFPVNEHLGNRAPSAV